MDFFLTISIAAAAAKINAQLQARKGIQHVDVPPIKSASPDTKAPDSSADSDAGIKNEMYVADGDYIQDIEVNDLRNRYLLTKGSTQDMVNTLAASTNTPQPTWQANTASVSRTIMLISAMAYSNPSACPC